MKRSRLAAAALAVVLPSLPGFAQSGPAAAPPPTAPASATGQVVRVFEIRYQDVQEVSLVLPTLLSESNVLTVDRASRTVTVVDRPEFVERVARFLEQFDVPPHAVLVRIVVEKAQRQPGVAGAQDAASAPGPGAAAWSYVKLAEATMEVLERGHAETSAGEDGTFEIRVRLGTVDAERRLMHFDELAVGRRDAPGAPAREMFSTSLEVQERVGKVVMASREASDDVALVVRVLGLIREGGAAAPTPASGPAPAREGGR